MYDLAPPKSHINKFDLGKQSRGDSALQGVHLEDQEQLYQKGNKLPVFTEPFLADKTISIAIKQSFRSLNVLTRTTKNR